MEFLAKQVQQIGTHLRGLSPSQVLALGLCVVLLLGGSLWLTQWAGEPEWVPLLEQPMTAEQVTAIAAQFQAGGHDFRAMASSILVRASDRTRLQGLAAQSGALPADTTIGFAKLIEESNMWLSREESQWQRKIALGNELAKVISSFDGVAEARVFIDQAERRSFGPAATAPTASVFLRTRPNATLDKSRVAAIASLVSGAIHGLKADAVHIVDATTGRPFRVPASETAIPFDLLELRQQKEDYYGRKILAQLSYIAGVLVGVNVELDTNQRHERIEKFGPPVVSEEEASTSESLGRTAAAVPGVRPNTAASIEAPGSTDSSTSEESRTSLLGERDKSITDQTNTMGDVRSVTASVNVPRSYFVAVFRQLNAGREPSADDLKTLIEGELQKVRAQVKQLIAATSDGQVEVSWFYDGATAPPGAAMDSAQSEGVTALARSYGKEAALGVLALVSVWMAFQMARRAAPIPHRPAGGAAALAAAPTGGAPGGESTNAPRKKKPAPSIELDEPEPDQAVLRLEAMLKQIQELVEKDASIGCAIVDRWLTHDR